MPRANRYLLPGYAYHLTHRCHDQAWLLKGAPDRNEYRSRLRAALPGSGVSLLAYCITRNHVHLLATAGEPERIPDFMRRVQGEYAEWYNRRRRRSGAFWDGRYHCTMVESGRHLWNCAVYIDLNMVRAGTVKHPRQWRWCGFDELTGRRSRYRLLGREKVAEYLAGGSDAGFASDYGAAVAEVLARGRVSREPGWTESIGVGSQDFVEGIAKEIHWRAKLEVSEMPGGAWTVREDEGAYGRGARTGPEGARAPMAPYSEDSRKRRPSKGSKRGRNGA